MEHMGRYLAQMKAEIESRRTRGERLSNGAAMSLSATGLTLTNLPKTPECEFCCGRKFVAIKVPFGHAEWGKILPCECAKTPEADLERLTRYTQLPLMFQEAIFDNFVWNRQDLSAAERDRLRSALSLAQAFAAGRLRQSWITFVSDEKGTGKTHLLSAILNHRIANRKDGPPGRFMEVPNLLAALREGIGSGSVRETFDWYQTCPLLGLDDLGSEYHRSNDGAMSWAEEQIFRLLNDRYVNLRQTIITCNSKVERIGPRIANRIMDTNVALVVDMNVASYRTRSLTQ